MIASQIKSKRQFTAPKVAQYEIQAYGAGNDFPQIIDEIVGASTTGVSCIRTYAKFIAGQGFMQRGLGAIKVGASGETLNDLRRWVANDFARYGGFAIHLNYNLLGEIVTVTPVPFPCFRLGMPANDDETKEVKFVKFHPDWGRRIKERKWSADDIVKYRLYNAETAADELRADGVDKYTGQILYFNGEDIKGQIYGLPIYTPALTNMRAEEALSNVTARNVCSNFMPAGMLVDIKAEEQDEEQLAERQAQIARFQGDEAVGSVWYVQVRDKSQVPEFVKMTAENFDKAFTATEEALPERIGKVFNQPPILRAEDIGSGFGAELVANSYMYYNATTHDERGVVSDIFREIFQHFVGGGFTGQDFEIEPLIYGSKKGIAEQKGESVAKDVIELVKDASVAPEMKELLFRKVYGLDEKTAKEFAGINDEPSV